MIEIELANRSGLPADQGAIEALARRALIAEGIESGDLGIALVGPEEIQGLKRDHLAIDEATDVLSFPIDGRDALEAGVPRQLGDVIICLQVVGEAWQQPLVHGLLHLLGYDHGAEMDVREASLLA